MRMSVPTSFAELTDNVDWQRELQEVYGHVEKVDLLVGMHAETPPPGFAISDTAFRIFILMAGRRIKSDRFFTDDFTPEVYTAGRDRVGRAEPDAGRGHAPRAGPRPALRRHPQHVLPLGAGGELSQWRAATASPA